MTRTILNNASSNRNNRNNNLNSCFPQNLNDTNNRSSNNDANNLKLYKSSIFGHDFPEG